MKNQPRAVFVDNESVGGEIEVFLRKKLLAYPGIFRSKVHVTLTIRIAADQLPEGKV